MINTLIKYIKSKFLAPVGPRWVHSKLYFTQSSQKYAPKMAKKIASPIILNLGGSFSGRKAKSQESAVDSVITILLTVPW